MSETKLTTKQMMNYQLAALRLGAVGEGIEQIHELYSRAKVFEAVVWFPRLQSQVNGSDSRGMSDTCQDVKVLTWCCAGRCLIQLELGDARITLISADDEIPWQRDKHHVAPPMGSMGIQSIDASFLDALTMLYKVTRYGGEIILKPDSDVTIG